MNAIIGLSGLALKTDLTSKQFDYLKKIEMSAQSLLGIINDILDFSKIEAGRMDMEHIDFNLEDVLANVSNLISLKAEEKGIELLFDMDKSIPVHLVGDPLRLGQVLINLANNAVKFTEKGQIILTVRRMEDETPGSDRAGIQFSVKDSGIGMTKEQMDRLFTSFTQADSSHTRKYGGTGLGLTISKRLVEMMGGQIRVQSEYGKGSSFSFTAFFGVQKDAPAKKRIIPRDLRGMKVLLVDDNPRPDRFCRPPWSPSAWR